MYLITYCIYKTCHHKQKIKTMLEKKYNSNFLPGDGGEQRERALENVEQRCREYHLTNSNMHEAA